MNLNEMLNIVFGPGPIEINDPEAVVMISPEEVSYISPSKIIIVKNIKKKLS